MEDIGSAIVGIFGSLFGRPGSASTGQMALRALIVYATGLALVRLGATRFLGKLTAFDAVIGVLIGSVLGRAINGSAPLGPTLIAAATLVALHTATAALAVRSDGFGKLVKGRARLLVRGGEVQWSEMRKSHLSERDLLEMVRLRGVAKISEVEEARLERNGDISIIRRQGDADRFVAD